MGSANPIAFIGGMESQRDGASYALLEGEPSVVDIAVQRGLGITVAFLSSDDDYAAVLDSAQQADAMVLAVLPETDLASIGRALASGANGVVSVKDPLRLLSMAAEAMLDGRLLLPDSVLADAMSWQQPRETRVDRANHERPLPTTDVPSARDVEVLRERIDLMSGATATHLRAGETHIDLLFDDEHIQRSIVRIGAECFWASDIGLSLADPPSDLAVLHAPSKRTIVTVAQSQLTNTSVGGTHQVIADWLEQVRLA